MSSTPIPIEEVRFHSCSYEDPAGRLFWKEGRLYRGLRPEGVPFYDELFRSGVIDELVREGLLIESWITPHTMAGYPRIVEHAIVPFVSYAHEWCPEMLRAAGRLVLEIAARLHGRGLELVDGHAWNVLFRGPHPVFVDLGAIGPASSESEWLAAGQFRKHFLIPLQIAAWGAPEIERALVRSSFEGGVSQDVLRHFRREQNIARRARSRGVRLAKRVLSESAQERLKAGLGRRRSGGSPATHIRYLTEELESVSLPSVTAAAGIDVDPSLRERVARRRPRTVLAIGVDPGFAAGADSIIALDRDGARVSRIYLDALRHSLPVLPVVMDIRNPSPAAGPSGEVCPPAWDRFACEMVFALGILPYLALRSHLTFDHIAACLRRYAVRSLLIDFPNPVEPVRDDSGYTAENLQAALRRHFRTVESIPASQGRPHYLCET